MNLQTFLFILGLMFIWLQLNHVIDWSLWVVTAPLWVLPLMQFTAGLIVGFMKGLAARKAKRNASA